MKKRSFTILLALISIASLASAQVASIDDREQAYQARTDTHIRTLLHEGNRATTDEERTFISDHWRRTARLFRIRQLATTAHDDAAVARVDALLTRADAALEHHLGQLRQRAPVMNDPPPTYDVTMAPPPPQVEVQGAAPSPQHVWTPGYWNWNGSRHVWSQGQWTVPPEAGMTYEAPRWETHEGRYHFHPGRWRPAQVQPNVVYEPPMPQQQIVEVQTAPPPPLVEVRPPAPSPNHVWIPGSWQWTGNRHTWVTGRWSAPRAGSRWEPDHWVRTQRGYRMERGRWVR